MSTLVATTLPQRIAFPAPADRLARAAVQRSRAYLRAGRELRRGQERLAAFARDPRSRAELTELASAAAPDTTDASCWPTDVQELAGKIQRQAIMYRDGRQVNRGNLRPGEEPVRDRDRQIVLKALPPSVGVQRCDPTYS